MWWSRPPEVELIPVYRRWTRAGAPVPRHGKAACSPRPRGLKLGAAPDAIAHFLRECEPDYQRCRLRAEGEHRAARRPPALFATCFPSGSKVNKGGRATPTALKTFAQQPCTWERSQNTLPSSSMRIRCRAFKSRITSWSRIGVEIFQFETYVPQNLI